MAHVSLPIRLSLSEIRWDGNLRYPFTKGCYGFEHKVSPPTPSQGVQDVQAFRALREVQSTVMQRFLARKKSLSRVARWAQPYLQPQNKRACKEFCRNEGG